MIDTTIVMYPLSLEPRHLQGWVENPRKTPDGKVHGKFFQKDVHDGVAPLSFLYYPPNPGYSEPWFSIKASLPKALYGSNIAMITSEAEIEEAVQAVNKAISRLSWAPHVDFGQGKLWRIDPAYNHSVGDRVQDWITALSRLTYSQRKTAPYLYEGVQYRSSSRRPTAVTKFYDKGKESHNPLAAIYLRQEATHRRAYHVERRMGIQSPTLRDVKIGWLVDILNHDLEELHLHNVCVYQRDQASEILLAKYGWNKGRSLYGHLLLRQSMTYEQMQRYGAKVRTIQRNDKDIADAGVSLALLDTPVPLPPLCIDLKTPNMAGSRK